ncbi:vesicle transport protein USE1-like [Diaphorina citri]|uniref:Vesicle transport protein USE1 n=1 Tax=Diaphorina citri TaxID=121845 RepID=A0A3Q0IZV0_DIACI|nr:vesicle transport protein USE1-like [Diaphorina citri]
MVLSRTEIKIRRLLARCEFMVDENNEDNSWRIEKFVEGLEDMILTLKKENDEEENMDKRLVHTCGLFSYQPDIGTYFKI